MRDRLIQNLKHIPSTLAGIGVMCATLPTLPAIQTYVGMSPRVSRWIAALAAVGAAASLIFGVGGNSSKV